MEKEKSVEEDEIDLYHAKRKNAVLSKKEAKLSLDDIQIQMTPIAKEDVYDTEDPSLTPSSKRVFIGSVKEPEKQSSLVIKRHLTITRDTN